MFNNNFLINFGQGISGQDKGHCERSEAIPKSLKSLDH